MVSNDVQERRTGASTGFTCTQLLVLGSAVVHKHTSYSDRVKDFYSSMHQNSKHINQVSTLGWNKMSTQRSKRSGATEIHQLNPSGSDQKDRASSFNQLNLKCLGRNLHFSIGVYIRFCTSRRDSNIQYLTWLVSLRLRRDPLVG